MPIFDHIQLKIFQITFNFSWMYTNMQKIS